MLKYKQDKQESVNKLLSFLRLIKLRKELTVPAESIHEAGVLMGYTCPRCGKTHCIYEFCLACGQRLAYDYNNLSYTYCRYKDVDDMVEHLHESYLKLSKEEKEENLNNFGLANREFLTIKEKRNMYKISLTSLIENDYSKQQVLQNKK